MTLHALFWSIEYFPVAIGLLGNLVLAYYYTYFLQGESLTVKLASNAGLMMLFPLAIIMWGSIFRSRDSHIGAYLSVWLTGAIVFLSQLIVIIIFIYRMPGRRWFACSVSAIQLWLSLTALFVAVQAVSGIWLY